jgi:hypothetical protein
VSEITIAEMEALEWYAEQRLSRLPTEGRPDEKAFKDTVIDGVLIYGTESDRKRVLDGIVNLHERIENPDLVAAVLDYSEQLISEAIGKGSRIDNRHAAEAGMVGVILREQDPIATISGTVYYR